MIRIRQAAIRDYELLAKIGAETFYDSFAADNASEDMAAYLSASFNPVKNGLSGCLSFMSVCGLQAITTANINTTGKGFIKSQVKKNSMQIYFNRQSVKPG